MTDTPSPTPPRRRVRPLAILGALLGIAGFLLVAYFSLALFLFDLFGEAWLNRRPEKSLMRWDSAKMVAPGEIVFRGFELRGRNRQVAWSLALDAGTVHLSLIDLLAREIHLESLEGEGVQFRLVRLTPEPAPVPAPEPSPDPPTTENPAATPVPRGETGRPTIEGFAPWPATPTVAKRPPWILTVDQFTLRDVRELWIENYRYRADTADGKASGRLAAHFRQSFEVPAVDLDLPAGQLDLGREDLAQLETLKIRGSLDPTITRRRPAEDLLDKIRAEVEVAAKRGNIGVFEHYLRGSQIELGGEGQLHAQIVVDRGELGAGSQLDFRGDGLSLRYFGYLGEGQGFARLNLEKGPGGGTVGRLETVLEKFKIGLEGAGEAHLAGENLRLLALMSEPGPVGRARVQATVELPPTRIPDLAVYNTYLPARLPFRWVRGAGTISSRFEVDTAAATAQAEVRLEARQFRAEIDRHPLVGDLDLRAVIQTRDLTSRDFELRGTHLDLDHVRADWYPPTTDWWARFEFSRGRLQLRKPLVLDGQLDARLQDSSPILALLLAKRPAVSWVEKTLTAEDLQVRSRLRVNGRTLAFEDFHLEGQGDLRLDAQFALDGGEKRGLFHLDLGLLSAGIELAPGDVDWKLRRSRRWYEERARSFWREIP